MRQRKSQEPSFKLPLFYSDGGGTDRLFVGNISDRTIHDVRIAVQGHNVTYIQSIRPAAFVEVNWRISPGVMKAVTWGGHREDILAYDSLKSTTDAVSELAASTGYEMLKPWAEYARQRVEQIQAILPPDLEGWKNEVHRFPLRISYTTEDGRRGELNGTLRMDMVRLWFGFEDDRGNPTDLR